MKKMNFKNILFSAALAAGAMSSDLGEHGSELG
mgnify:CR=1 FL=1